MFALLALIMGFVLVYTMWRLMDPSRKGDASSNPEPRTRAPRPVRRAPLPPDDNPEFLRELNSRLPARGGVIPDPDKPDKKKGEGDAPQPA